MKIKAVQKYVRMSPQKLRLVASIAKQMEPEEAVSKLPFLKKRAKEPIIKVIKTALANGKAQGISPDQLEFEEIQINEGPRLKRGRAVSRGRWHPYQRRMSHIRIILKTREEIKGGQKKEVVESVKEKSSEKKSKKISLDQIRKLGKKKDDKQKRVEKDVKMGSQKSGKGAAKDIKTVRTTNK